MPVRPLHDRVVIRRSDDVEQRVGGIIVPDSAKEKPQEGTVIAVGLGRATKTGKRIPLDITAGDRILFGKFSGQEVTLDGEDYIIMTAYDVLSNNNDSTTLKRTVITGRTKKKHTATKKLKGNRSKGTSMKKEPRKAKKRR
jgi:chaperonin GroES